MERILQRWYDMISINSVNGHEAAMADYVANVLREIGMDPHYSYFDEDTARERPSLWSVLDSGRPGIQHILHPDTRYQTIFHEKADAIGIGILGLIGVKVIVRCEKVTSIFLDAVY